MLHFEDVGYIRGTVGLTCPKCGTRIRKNQIIQQGARGRWQHSTCLVVVVSNPAPQRTAIASVFLYPNRVSFHEAFEALEPDDGKLSRPVLRGPGLSNGVRLLDPGVWARV